MTLIGHYCKFFTQLSGPLKGGTEVEAGNRKRFYRSHLHYLEKVVNRTKPGNKTIAGTARYGQALQTQQKPASTNKDNRRENGRKDLTPLAEDLAQARRPGLWLWLG